MHVSLTKMFRTFLRSTSIHGLRYLLREDGRCYRDRFLWLLFIILAMGSSSFFIVELLNKQAQSPLMVTIQSVMDRSKFFDFPSITVCNIDIVIPERLKKQIQTQGYNSTEAEMIAALINELVSLEGASERATAFEQSLQILKITVNHLLAFLKEHAQPCSEMVIYCAWQNQQFPCSSYTQGELTDMGYCCTVANKASRKTVRREYTVPFKNGTVRSVEKVKAFASNPLNNSRWTRILGNTTSGIRRGLQLILRPWEGSDQSSTLKVLVHDPSDPPVVRHWAIPIQTGMITFMGVTVKRIYTTQQALRYPISIRNCFADGEGSVYGGIENYNLKACFRNCIIYRSITNCSCVPYYYGEWSNFSICTVKNYQCLKNRIKWNPVLRAFNPKCWSCKPKCESTSYDVTFDTVTHSTSNCFVSEMCEDISGNTTSIARDTAFLYMYLKSDSAATFKRDVLYGWNDLLSGIGGLLSLGIGISLLHIFEVAYLIFFR